MRFHTQTAGVSLTPQQPLNNLTRVALQALAGVLGGTQSLHTDAYDEALAVPTAEAALLALRQQQVIAEESGVDATVDPLGGSWFVEALTDETERQVWRYLDEIDRRGGMVAAVEEGYPAARDRRRGVSLPARVRCRASGGSSGSTPTSTRPRRRRVPVLAVPPGSLERHLARLERTRRERDASGRRGGAARACARRRRGPGTSETNLMPHFIRCAAAYATLGEQCARPARRLRGVPRAGRGLATGPAMRPRRSSTPMRGVGLSADGVRRCVDREGSDHLRPRTASRVADAELRVDLGDRRRQLEHAREPRGKHLEVCAGRRACPPGTARPGLNDTRDHEAGRRPSRRRRSSTTARNPARRG